MGKRKQFRVLESNCNLGSSARINPGLEPTTETDSAPATSPTARRIFDHRVSTAHPRIIGSLLCNVIEFVSEMPLRSIGTWERDEAASNCTANAPCLST